MDVRAIDGITCFCVVGSEDVGTRLKTASSERIVPVHPMLGRLGLLAFIDQRRKADPGKRIFEDIEPGSDGSYSHNFSKYFGRYTRSIGVHTARTAFHSFRHNFTDALRRADAQDSQIKALLGHSDTSTTAGYGSGLPAKTLYHVIERVRYDVDLEFLLPYTQGNSP
jgi:integrase